jgi:hypothetical protein
MLRHATRRGRPIVLAAGILTGVATAALISTGLQVSRGFEQALQSRQAGLSFETTHAASRNSSAIAGDGGFWLTRAEVDSPTPFAKPLAVGDRITIAGKGGRVTSLEVADITAVGGGIVRTGTGQTQLLLVTCRVVGAAGEQTQHPVRFIVESGSSEPLAPAPSKAL